MRYMLLILFTRNGYGKDDPQDADRIQSSASKRDGRYGEARNFSAAQPLKPTATATTVRFQNDQPDDNRWPIRGTRAVGWILHYSRLQGSRRSD